MKEMPRERGAFLVNTFRYEVGAEPLLVLERFSLRESTLHLEKEGLRRGIASPCLRKDSR